MTVLALARDHQEKLGAGGWMRADDTTRLDREAGQVDLALARRDARGGESPAAVPADDPLPAIELEDLHGTPPDKRMLTARQPGVGNPAYGGWGEDTCTST